MRKILWILFFCTLIGLAGNVYAGGGGKSSSYHSYHGKSKHHGLDDKYFDKYEFFMRNSEELSLNKEQTQALKDIKMAVKRSKIEADAAKQLAMLDVWSEMHKDNPSLEAINGHIDLKMEAKTVLSKIYAKAILDSKAVLNAEQYAEAKEIWHKEKYSDKD